MEIILENDDSCDGITSFNGNLYLKLNNQTFIFKNNSLIKSSDQVDFNSTPHSGFLYKGDYLITYESIPNIGSPFHYLTYHDGYIYGYFGIDGLCLSRIKFPPDKIFLFLKSPT